MRKNILASGLKFVICSLQLVVLFFWPCFAKDKIVAVVNNNVITQKDLNDFVNFMRLQLSAEYSGKELEAKIQSMKLDLLDRLIEDSLILQEAKKENIKIDDSRVKVRVADIKRRYSSEAMFQKALAQQGITPADLETKIRDQMLIFSIIDLKIRSKIVVTPVEVTDFYEKHIDEFKLPEQREFEYIVVENEDLAKDIFIKLKDGQAIQDVVKRYSLVIDRISVSKGGQLKKDIEEVLFRLRPGEISEPLKIEEIFYIFKLINIIPQHQENVKESKDKIYAFLFNKKMEEELNRWLDELRSRAYIKVYAD